MKWLLGGIGFALFVVYDLNNVKFNIRWMKTLFPIGCFFILAGSAVAVWEDTVVGLSSYFSSVISIVLACVCLGVLIYTLFFALPFKETYVEEQDQSVCNVGMYAFCRHPGVIWFFLFFLFSGIAMQNGALLGAGMVMSGWNVLYVIFQDWYTFPKMFSDYGAYKRETPFLIPNRKSILRGIHTWPKK